MSYYHFQVSHIPIGRAGKPRQSPTTEGVVLDEVPVTVYKRPFWQWLKAWEEGCGYHSDGEGTLCYLKLEDNGQHGDGVQFTIFMDDEKYPLVETIIPDESLDTIIEALQAIRRLRMAEAPQPLSNP